MTQVHMIEGRHLTASDKRNILECVEYLRKQDVLDNPLPLLSRPGSRKSYILAPHKAGPDCYSVVVKTAERNDYGCPVERTSLFVVELKGVARLPWDRLLGFPHEVLNTDLTPAGEQFVIPGCERNASPKAVQLSLFG